MSETFYLQSGNKIILALPFSGKVNADLIRKMTVKVDFDSFLEDQNYYFCVCNDPKEDFERMIGPIPEECENVLWRLFQQVDGVWGSMNILKEECDQKKIISVEFHHKDDLSQMEKRGEIKINQELLN